MKKLILIALAAVSMIHVTAHAQIDYLGNHLETMRENNLRRHQQEMLRGNRNRKSKKRKAAKRSSSSNSTRNNRSSPSRKESNLPVSRLRVGDVIHAVRSGKKNLVFKGRTARVASRSPLFINLNGTSAKPFPKGNKLPLTEYAIVTSTGRRSGVIGILTLINPGSLEFTRSTN